MCEFRCLVILHVLVAAIVCNFGDGECVRAGAGANGLLAKGAYRGEYARAGYGNADEGRNHGDTLNSTGSVLFGS